MDRRCVGVSGTGIGRFFAAILAILLGASGARAGEPKLEPPTSAQIKTWIQQLDAPKYLARTDATTQLAAGGFAVVTPLLETLRQPNVPPEVIARGLLVLREVAKADEEAEAAIREGLVRIGGEPAWPASRRIREPIEEIDAHREKRATTALAQLGAAISETHQAIGFQFFENTRTITIGDDWKGRNEDLRRLQWLRNVRGVHFTGKAVNDDWFRHLGAMPDLQMVTVKRATIGNSAVEALKTRKLLALDVKYCPIDDGAIESLLALESVRVLRLYGTKISKEGSTRLKDGLGATRIDYRRGAFLGVGCQGGIGGCVVISVQRNSAAEKAGLQMDDVIVRFNDNPVVDFESLTALISENQPRDIAEVVVQRSGTPMTFKIELGEWE